MAVVKAVILLLLAHATSFDSLQRGCTRWIRRGVGGQGHLVLPAFAADAGATPGSKSGGKEAKAPDGRDGQMEGPGSGSGKQKKEVKKGACISQGGRFPPFFLHGKLPIKAPKGGLEALTFCRVYKEKTCCGKSQSEAAMASVRKLMVFGEASDECAAKWEALECATCHPVIGAQPGPPAICHSFCEQVLASCADAFFGADAANQDLVPCGPRDSVCSRLREWTSSPTTFCHMAGFLVVNRTRSATSAKDDPQLLCFDGSPALVGLQATTKGGKSDAEKRAAETRKGDSLLKAWIEKLKELAKDGNSILWLVAGLVLTAGLLFMSWSSGRSRRRRAAMMNARKLAGRLRTKTSDAATRELMATAAEERSFRSKQKNVYID